MSSCAVEKDTGYYYSEVDRIEQEFDYAVMAHRDNISTRKVLDITNDKDYQSMILNDIRNGDACAAEEKFYKMLMDAVIVDLETNPSLVKMYNEKKDDFCFDDQYDELSDEHY